MSETLALVLGGAAAVTSLSAIGLGIALVLERGRRAEAETGRDVAVGKLRAAEVQRDAAVDEAARLTKQLNAARAAKQESHANHAENGDPGGGTAVDDALDRIRRVYPDADDPDAGGGPGGKVSGNGA